jgi:hypothetical protein
MSNITEDKTPEMLAAELEALKNRATMLGIPFPGNIGIDALSAKIKDFQEAKEKQESELMSQVELDAQMSRMSVHERKMRIRQKLVSEYMYLMRVNIVCLNPQKSDLKGEIYTVMNSYLGAVKHYVPYNAQEHGWHLPRIMVDHLRERKFQQIRVKQDSRGQRLPETKWVPEFTVTELPYLTTTELRHLANAQAAAAGQGM